MHEESPISTCHVSVKIPVNFELASPELDKPREHSRLPLQEF